MAAPLAALLPLLARVAPALLSRTGAAAASSGAEAGIGRVLEGIIPGITGNAKKITEALAGGMPPPMMQEKPTTGSLSAAAANAARRKLILERLRASAKRGAVSKAELEAAIGGQAESSGTMHQLPGPLPPVPPPSKGPGGIEQFAEVASKVAQFTKVLSTAVGLLIGFGVAVLGANKAVERFATHIVENYRDLAKWNGKLATMFALMDRQQMILGGRHAAATSGSARLAGGQLMALREEMLPLQELFGSLKNIFTTELLVLARILTLQLRLYLGPLELIAKFCEWLLGSGDPGAHSITHILNRMADNQLIGQPKNKRPTEGD